MKFTTIVCLDDLTRHSYWPAKEFVYDLIRTPIYHTSGIDISKSPRNGQRNNLLPGFDHSRFLQLCGPNATQGHWVSFHLGLPKAANEYLAMHIPDGALIIGYEMPPWLRSLLELTGHTWIDLRISPLRFASDLYIAIGTNSPLLHSRIYPRSVSMDEVLSEASLMAAQVRYHQRYDDRPRSYDGAWIYIGQTEADTSLVTAASKFARVQDYATILQSATADIPMLYKPHPGAGDFARKEFSALRDLISRPIALCETDTYEMLAGERPLGLIGLSSGVLQEAKWFGKSSLSLLAPVCQISFENEWRSGYFAQVSSHEFLSEPLWSNILGQDEPRARPLVHPPRANRLRELHDAWWGYAPHAARHNELLRHAVALHTPRQTTIKTTDTSTNDILISNLQSEIRHTQEKVATLVQEMDGLKDALRLVMRQTISRKDGSVSSEMPIEV